MSDQPSDNLKVTGGPGITAGHDVIIGDISGELVIKSYIKNVNKFDPKMVDAIVEALTEKLIKSLNIDPKIVPVHSAESPSPHIDEQIREIEAAQSQIEDLGYLSTAERSYNLGMLEAYRRDYEIALAYFNRAVQKNPEYKQAYKSIARLQQYLAIQEVDENKLNSAGNRLNSARSAVDISLQLDPLDTDTLARRGYIYKTLGHLSEAQGKVNEKQAHFAEAERMFEHLLLSDPTNASVQNGWGNIQYILGNLDTAIAAYNHAIELHPQYTAAFHI